jgi:N-acetylmuramoyl-L-alanine amidase
MAKPYMPYVIKNGEHLEQVAMRLGFDCKAVWHHHKNREIREKRKGKFNLLCAGDLVFVPKPSHDGLQFAAHTVNRFVAKVPKTTIDMHFGDSDGPFANERYVFSIEGTEAEGTTDGDGKATFSLPMTCNDVEIEFPDRKMKMTAKVGHLDPIEEPTGVRQRLKNLGHIEGDVSDDEDAEARRLEHAIFAFQRAQKIKVTGKMDEATTAKLAEVCKS